MPAGGSDVDLLLNDLSFHGQFSDVPAFKAAIQRIMSMRQLARRFGRELHCHRELAHAQVTHDQRLPQVLQALAKDEQRALMQWFTRQGPYWDDARLHSPGDYLEYGGEVVTDKALGEAAFAHFSGIDSRLASLCPSNFEASPLKVTWLEDQGAARSVDVPNYWEERGLEAALRDAPVVVSSWEQMADLGRTRCNTLTFTTDCFEPLRGHPFVDGAARQILVLLDALDRFRQCFDANGQRTQEGQRLYQEHFTGDKAWFSDSSDAEKHEFRTALHFRDPRDAETRLFCPWHGKVKTPQIRIHFSWPVPADEPLYVVFVGPKITKR